MDLWAPAQLSEAKNMEKYLEDGGHSEIGGDIKTMSGRIKGRVLQPSQKVNNAINIQNASAGRNFLSQYLKMPQSSVLEWRYFALTLLRSRSLSVIELVN